LYKVGDKVVYPHHGAGTVVKREKKEVLGETREYLTIKIDHNEMTVNVTARQFAFEFTYPHQGSKNVVSPILYLPRGRPVVFKIRSYDVVHSFFVPQFAEKIDAVPGITTTLRVTPTRIGVYPAECTELCGPGHSFMRAQVRVVTPAAFQTWLSKQPNNAPPPIGTPPPSNGSSQAHTGSSSGGGK